MIWKPIFVVALALHPAAVRADCEAEAIKAREKILTSGPFHYSTRIWDASFSAYDWKKAGLIEPNKAEHAQEISSKNAQYHKYKYQETITIGKQRWKKGDEGWFLPISIPSFPADYDSVVPDINEAPLATKCLGQVNIDGKDLTGYEFQTKITRDLRYTEKLFVEPGTGLTVRYERIAPRRIFDAFFLDVISTYRYDASINIEPPKVDLDDFPPPLPAQAEVNGKPRSNAATKF